MEAPDITTVDEPTMVASQSADIIWMFFCLVLVTLMQPGFACYEVGVISGSLSIRPILLKNIGDASVSLVSWLFIGYALASGGDAGGLFGRRFFFFTGDPFAETPEQSAAMAYLRCLYQWSFAAACTTIISDAFLTSAVFYPVLAHWVWAEGGWASATNSDPPLLGCGVIDFAGSGVVHMLGGGIALMIAAMVGPRQGRFFEPHAFEESTGLKNHTNSRQINEADFSSNDMAWTTLGCFLLWIGWYGFNCGSTFQISTVESQRTAGRAAMNTTIAAAFGCLSSMAVEMAYHLCSPSYRRPRLEDGDEIDPDVIEDPLHKAGSDWTVSTVDNLKEATLGVLEQGLVSDEEMIQRIEQLQQATAGNQLDNDAGTTENETDYRDIVEKNKDLKDRNANEKIIRTIQMHRAEHNVRGPWWRSFIWASNSTHKNLHGAAVNGILAGCATMSHGSALGVSFVSALAYHVSYRGFICLKIDDAIGAGAIHFVCGFWGLIAAGLTATEAARLDAGYPSNDECSWNFQLLVNVLMGIIIVIYAICCTTILFGILKLLEHWKLAKVFATRRHPRLEDKNLADHKQRVKLTNERIQERFADLEERFDELQASLNEIKADTTDPEEEQGAPDMMPEETAIHNKNK